MNIVPKRLGRARFFPPMNLGQYPGLGPRSKGMLLGLLLVIGLCAAACTPSGPATPAPSIQTPASTPVTLPTVGAPSPSPSASDATLSPSPVVASPTPQLNGTTVADAANTAIAVAVDGTVTARLQSAATAVALTPGAVATFAATALSTPIAAATAVAGCPVQPIRGFGLVYTANPNVASRLGCAVQPEAGTSSVVQLFDGGVMLEFGNSKQILVLQNKGSTWSNVQDTYQTGQVLPTPSTAPPAGRVAPVNGFGKVWLERQDIQSQLGWPTGPEQQFPTGASELFAHGRMFWTPLKTDYVLYADNTWTSFPDTFQG
jgi:hypothetical protein